MCARKIAWSSYSCRPWCTAIVGYHTSRKTSYNQWLATDKQEIHYRARVSQGEKTTPNGRYLWQFKYVNAIHIVLYMSNGLICAYTTDIHDKRIAMSCTMWHLPQTIGVFRLLSSILSNNNFAIIYSTDNL